MWKNLWRGLKKLLGSSKFQAAVTTVVAAGVARAGFDVDPSLVAAGVGLGAALVLGQGIADTGKEAEKVKAAVAAGHQVDKDGNPI